MNLKETNRFYYLYNLEEHNELGKRNKQTYGIKREVQYLDGNKHAVLVKASINP
jgi:hypothetical protein